MTWADLAVEIKDWRLENIREQLRRACSADVPIGWARIPIADVPWYVVARRMRWRERRPIGLVKMPQWSVPERQWFWRWFRFRVPVVPAPWRLPS